MLQAKRKAADGDQRFDSLNIIRLHSDDGVIELPDGNNDHCSLNNNVMQLRGSHEDNCRIIVHFSDRTCETDTFKFISPQWASVYSKFVQNFTPLGCLKVSKTSGYGECGPNWPCQDDGCWRSVNLDLWVERGELRNLHIDVAWTQIGNMQTEIEVTDTSNVNVSGSKVSEMSIGADAAIHFAGHGLNGAFKRQVTTSIKYEFQRGRKVVTKMKIDKCPVGQDPWQYVISVDGRLINTMVVRCVSGDYGPPKCPVNFCGSLVSGANDCQCCLGGLEPKCH